MSQTNNKRIAKNTIALYLRMFITMGVGIYTSRVVLNALGISDYGLYNVVGGIIGFIATATNAMTIAVQRFLNIEIGKGKDGNVGRVFSQALLIHVLLAAILFIGIETIGLYYFHHYLNIPEGRYSAAFVVFNLSTVGSCISLVAIPYYALIISYEKMSVYAYTSIIDVMLKLAIVYILYTVSGDRLVIYGTLMLLVTIASILINITICRCLFKHIKPHFVFDKSVFFNMTSFASWTVFGQIAWAFTLQGVNLLLNFFFGTFVNAAYGIASQVMNVVSRFTSSFQTAMNPQIMKSYAAGETEQMMQLVYRGTRISTYLLAIIIIPITFKIDYILQIWLVNVPTYATTFCTLVLMNMLLDMMSNYFATAVQAVGKIRKYQLWVSSILIMNFPLSWVALQICHLPYLIYIVYAIISITLLFTRIILLSSLINQTIIKDFFRCVIFRNMAVLVISLCVSYGLSLLFNSPHLLSVIVFLILSCLSTAIISFCVGITKSEQKVILSSVSKLYSKWHQKQSC